MARSPLNTGGSASSLTATGAASRDKKGSDLNIGSDTLLAFALRAVDPL
jgi:hypothetical protein